MSIKNGSLLATLLATQVSQQIPSAHRGAALLRCEGEDSLVAAVFGNEPYEQEPTHQQVEDIRDWLREGEIEELGFGLSEDASTWAMILRLETERYDTEIGRKFYMEMVQARLDNVVHPEWRTGWQHNAAKAATPTGDKCPAVG